MRVKVFRNIAIVLLALGGIAFAGYYFYFNSLAPCRKPLEYSIGRLDSQFGVSPDVFKTDITEAGTVWEKALGRSIFVYDPDSPFKINLVYDERQMATIQKQRTESGLSVVEAVFKNRDVEFQAFKAKYDQRVAAYQQAVDAYNQRKADYDQEVSSWNTKGGAPKEKYDALEAERRYLNGEAERLNTEASALKDMTAELNRLLAERNSKATEYNKVAKEYNNKYDQGLEFNQAEYNGKEINIYQFNTKQDLVLALSHELGHALNLNHVDNPQSVMYYLTGVNATTKPVLSAEDLAELNRVCNKQ